MSTASRRIRFVQAVLATGLASTALAAPADAAPVILKVKAPPTFQAFVKTPVSISVTSPKASLKRVKVEVFSINGLATMQTHPRFTIARLPKGKTVTRKVLVVMPCWSPGTDPNDCVRGNILARATGSGITGKAESRKTWVKITPSP